MPMAKINLLTKWLSTDSAFANIYYQLSPQKQKLYHDILMGKRVPNLLNDTIFKNIFHPDKYPDRLSSLISSIIGQEVTVLHSLSGETTANSIYSKRGILDLVVRFKNQSFGHVEIQRKGLFMPPERSVFYSADLIKRQYSIPENELKSNYDYTSIMPVYSIIFMEESHPAFAGSSEYIHHFRQKSDSGVELELLQYYDYVCLDIFRKKHPEAAGELERWLTFFSIRTPSEMTQFLLENPALQPVYESAIMMMSERKELMYMFIEELANEDVAAVINDTNRGRIRKLEARIEDLEALLAEKDETIAKKDKEMVEKDNQIRELTKRKG
jgi:hypothetical protein